MEPLVAVRHSIETATAAGRARSEEMFRCVDVLQNRSQAESDPMISQALLEAAMDILRGARG